MKALHVTLSGKTAFFKKPEVNTFYYFTYGNIHKVALLGIFGAILGYGGYTQMKAEKRKSKDPVEGYPEFYERLQNLKVSIVPNAEKGFIPKKIQTFNNSVGYASKEQGGNLIVKEQWLENPSWDIWVLLDSEEAERLADVIQNHKCVFSPYLGKNDHYADLKNSQIEEIEEAFTAQGRVSSMVLKEKAVMAEMDDEDDDNGDFDVTFKYEEMLPLQLDSWTNQYLLKSFLFTDGYLAWENQDVFQKNGKYLMFY